MNQIACIAQSDFVGEYISVEGICIIVWILFSSEAVSRNIFIIQYDDPIVKLAQQLKRNTNNRISFFAMAFSNFDRVQPRIMK